MKIVGDGKDYYDGVMYFGTDDSRIFTRHNIYTEFFQDKIFDRKEDYSLNLISLRTKFSWKDARRVGYDSCVWEFKPRIITTFSYVFVIFAGIRYFCIYETTKNYSTNEVTTQYFWKLDDLLAYLEKNGVSLTKNDKWRKNVLGGNLVRKLYEPTKIVGEEFEYLVKNNILIAIGKENNIFDNRRIRSLIWFINTDGLKELQFAKVLDPWTAYQELDMFLGSVLVSDQDKMVKVSDASKIMKYGYDKWSFRNQVHPAKPRSERK